MENADLDSIKTIQERAAEGRRLYGKINNDGGKCALCGHSHDGDVCDDCNCRIFKANNSSCPNCKCSMSDHDSNGVCENCGKHCG